jgi:hypothetical protein
MASPRPSLGSFSNFMKKMRGNPVVLEFVADLYIARRRLSQLANAIGVRHFRAHTRASPANRPDCFQLSSISLEHTTRRFR